jgi:uncharacterized protein with PIN domain
MVIDTSALIAILLKEALINRLSSIVKETFIVTP